jgi:hypothetical protein
MKEADFFVIYQNMHIITALKDLFRLKTKDSTNDNDQPPPYDYGIKSQSNECSDARSTNPAVAPTKQAYGDSSDNKLQSDKCSDAQSTNHAVAPTKQVIWGNIDHNFQRNKGPSRWHAHAQSTNPVLESPMQAFCGNMTFLGKVETVNIRREPGEPSEVNFWETRNA